MNQKVLTFTTTNFVNFEQLSPTWNDLDFRLLWINTQLLIEYNSNFTLP